MEFLVHIEVHWPPDGDEQKKNQLIKAETLRASELTKAGTIRRLWRVPGKWANYGIWFATDASELHAALSSLPFYPWLEIQVTPLAVHPSDPGWGVSGIKS
jgi:muconolactone D-isomerase